VSNRPSHPPGRRARLAVLDMSVVRPMTAPPATATQQTSTSASMSVIGAAALPGPTAGRNAVQAFNRRLGWPPWPRPAAGRRSGCPPAPWLASVATAGWLAPWADENGARAARNPGAGRRESHRLVADGRGAQAEGCGAGRPRPGRPDLGSSSVSGPALRLCGCYATTNSRRWPHHAADNS
jgi:hypothetical protein